MRRLVVVMVLVGVALAAQDAAAGTDTLRLEASVGKAQVTSGKPIELQATFRSVGQGTVKVYVPQHVGSVPFPQWVLESADGARYAPYMPAFQTEWKVGLQGAVIELRPEAPRHFTTAFSRVVRLGAADEQDLTDAVALPPGTYTVRCTYAKKDDTVPYGDADMSKWRAMKSFPGLWTGRVEAEPVTFEVLAPQTPVLEIEAPKDVPAGSPFRLLLRVKNLGSQTFEGKVAFDVQVGQKARAAGWLRLVSRKGRLVPAERPDQVEPVLLVPGASLEGEADLSALDFHLASQFPDPRPLGFYDVLGRGLFRLTVNFVDGGDNTIAAVSWQRRVMPPASGEASGLVLSLAPAPGGSPRFVVTLKNEGEKAVRVPAALSYPGHVYFSLVRPGEKGAIVRTQGNGGLDFGAPAGKEPGEEAKIGAGLSWNSDVFEPRAREGVAYVLLQPGSEVSRVFSLRRLVLPDPTREERSLVLQAYYRNCSSGRRVGMEDVFVGWLVSRDLVLEPHDR